MDPDLIESGRPSRSKDRFRKNGVGKDEKERRRRENMWYNCRKSGHHARRCYSKLRRLHMMNEERTGMIEKVDTIMKTYEDPRDPCTAQDEPRGVPREENTPCIREVCGSNRSQNQEGRRSNSDLTWDAIMDRMLRRLLRYPLLRKGGRWMVPSEI
jgi:hypothetical protein